MTENRFTNLCAVEQVKANQQEADTETTSLRSYQCSGQLTKATPRRPFIINRGKKFLTNSWLLRKKISGRSLLDYARGRLRATSRVEPGLGFS